MYKIVVCDKSLTIFHTVELHVHSQLTVESVHPAVLVAASSGCLAPACVHSGIPYSGKFSLVLIFV